MTPMLWGNMHGVQLARYAAGIGIAAPSYLGPAERLFVLLSQQYGRVAAHQLLAPDVLTLVNRKVVEECRRNDATIGRLPCTNMNRRDCSGIFKSCCSYDHLRRSSG